MNKRDHELSPYIFASANSHQADVYLTQPTYLQVDQKSKFEITVAVRDSCGPCEGTWRTATLEVEDGKMPDEERWRDKDVCNALIRKVGENEYGMFYGDIFGDPKVCKFRLVDPIKEPITQSECTVVGLDQLLRRRRFASTQESMAANSTTSKCLSPRGKIVLASNIAVYFIQTFSTPWQAPNWGKEDIWVFEDTVTSRPRPYVIRQFPIAQEYSFGAVNYALLRLGILLQEVCFGECIEDQAFFQDYLGPGGVANEFTHRAAAEQWLPSVAQEMGPGYSHVVKHCFAQSYFADSDDATFWQTISANIVDPLQKLAEGIDRFCSSK